MEMLSWQKRRLKAVKEERTAFVCSPLYRNECRALQTILKRRDECKYSLAVVTTADRTFPNIRKVINNGFRSYTNTTNVRLVKDVPNYGKYLLRERKF